ncbi:hypothetical protein [Methylosinus sporium]|uniref:hypothetical protein n=1 Tax=Methylosinus sporium TaxID=428 RepID=UPI00383B1E0D
MSDLDAHFGMARQNVREKAFPIRSQMHDDNEAHARICRHGAEQALQRLDAARGSADAYDWERCVRFHCGPFALLFTMGFGALDVTLIYDTVMPTSALSRTERFISPEDGPTAHSIRHRGARSSFAAAFPAPDDHASNRSKESRV